MVIDDLKQLAKHRQEISLMKSEIELHISRIQEIDIEIQTIKNDG